MLKYIEIKGYKSVREQTISFGRINVLIGANGSGKSNLISFFRMLGFLITGNLQVFVGRSGGAETFLHYGSKNTDRTESTMLFERDAESYKHYMCLRYGARDTFVFSEERISSQNVSGSETSVSFGPGHRESGLADIPNDKSHKTVRDIIRECRCHQFHDTSETAGLRQNTYIEDNRCLRDDGGNMAAFLCMLRQTGPEYYHRIVAAVRQVAPYFDDFDLRPGYDPKYIMLNWKERGADYVFGPHQLPDGLLRFMALATLLLSPEDQLPGLIVIDEPELGLHPFAINILGALIRKASYHSQLIIATQSLNLVDQFDPGDILVVGRRDSVSEFGRPDPELLKDWLKEYSLSELWEKNVIGGRPSL